MYRPVYIIWPKGYKLLLLRACGSSVDPGLQPCRTRAGACCIWRASFGEELEIACREGSDDDGGGGSIRREWCVVQSTSASAV